MAASTYAAVVGAIQLARRVGDDCHDVHGSAHPLLLAEDALRAHQQNDDEDCQRAGVTHIVGDDERAHVRHDADDQRADQRAVGGAEEDRRASPRRTSAGSGSRRCSRRCRSGRRRAARRTSPMITIHRKAPRVEASIPPSTTWRTVRPREIRAMNMPTNGPQDSHQPQ